MRLRVSPSGQILNQRPPLSANEGDVLVSRATATNPHGEWLPEPIPGSTITPLTFTWFVDNAFAGTPNGAINAPFPSIQSAFDAADALAATNLTLLIVNPGPDGFIRPSGNTMTLRFVGLGPGIPTSSEQGIVTITSIDAGDSGYLSLETLAAPDITSADAATVECFRCAIISLVSTASEAGSGLIVLNNCFFIDVLPTVSVGDLTCRYVSFATSQTLTIGNVLLLDSFSERSWLSQAGQLAGVNFYQNSDVQWPQSAQVQTDANDTTDSEFIVRFIYPSQILTAVRSLTLQPGATATPRKLATIDVWPQSNALTIIDDTSALTIYTVPTGFRRVVCVFDDVAATWSVQSANLLF